MEEHRCKIAAAEADDARCQGLLSSVLIGMEDPRCGGLQNRSVNEVDDHRYNNVAIAMEDPRCQGLMSKW